MMKKGAIFIATLLLLLLPSVIFADAKVTATDKADVVKITFTYTNPDAGEVYLPGTHNGWNPTATKMTKGADGTWTYELEVKPTDKVLYKFYVDGSWTEDGNAIATVDDGFGGLNAVIDVAARLAASNAPAGAAAVAAVPATSINFQLYARVFSDTKILTRDVLKGTTAGFEYDSTGLTAAAYPKISGTAVPGLDFFMELKVFDGSIKAYQANTMGNQTPFQTPYDALEDFGTALFNPFPAFSNGDLPLLGKLKVAWTNPYFVATTGYNWFQRGAHEFIYKTMNEVNSGLGYLEIANGKEISKIGNSKLETVVGFTKKNSNLGIYSWANLSGGDLSAELGFASASTAKSLFYYSDAYKAYAEAGFGYNLKDLGISTKVQGLYNFGTSFKDIETKDLVAAALQLNYKSDLFGVDTTFKYGGDKVDTLFGDNGGLKSQNTYAEVNPWVKPISLIKIGAKTNYKFDNTEIAKDYINMFFRPYVDLFLTENLTVNAYGSMNLDMVNMSTTALNQFKLAEAGVKLNMSKISDVLTSLKVIGAAKLDNSWNDTTKAMDIKHVYSSLTTEAGLPNDMKVVLGATLRTNLMTKPATTTQADWDTSLQKEFPYGFAAGFSWKLPIEEIHKPTLAVTFYDDFNPFENTYATAFKYTDDSTDAGGDTYILKDIETKGTKAANLCVGLVWDF